MCPQGFRRTPHRRGQWMSCVCLRAARYAHVYVTSESGRSPIELFDWIVLDTAENFHQSPEERGFIIDQALRAGYRLVEREHDIVVYARPLLWPAS